MSFLDRFFALIPFGKKEEILEYYFALNISTEKLTAALWTIEANKLQILETASENYSSHDQISQITDKLLDSVLGIKELEPQKILFGVPDSWLSDENLKEDYLKLLRGIVKELELTPMAYVATSHALTHFLEKQEGVPTTAILVGFENNHLQVIVVRAGKLDGAKIIQRGDNSGADIEKALLTFSDIETLPSKILIYGQDDQVLEKLKSQLLAFPWMSKLSFLHFPKIEILDDDIDIKSICFAGASEINSEVVYVSQQIPSSVTKPLIVSTSESETEEKEDMGFVVGDVSDQISEEINKESLGEGVEDKVAIPDQGMVVEAEDFEESEVLEAPTSDVTLPTKKKSRLPSLALITSFKRFLPKSKFTNLTFLAGILGIIILLLSAYLLLVKAEVRIFVEPKILEKDSQVTADPNQKQVNEDAKIIPGQQVSTEVSGSSKGEATGKKQIGDPAKGTVVVYNKTYETKSISKGTTLTSSNGLKFTLDTSVNIASQSATETGITFGKSNTTVTASTIGADSNLPSGSELTVANLPSSQVSAKAEGNFSGGTSKEVKVVSDADQKKLLATLAADLRRQAQQKLQENLKVKKILEESLSEDIIKKNYSKNINDQANDFSLNLTIRFKGTAFDDKDLKQIVSRLVTTQVPEGFELDLAETETQADVSKLEKDGRLIFLARFKAKLIPKLDISKIRKQIKGQTPSQVIDTLKGQTQVLGAEIKISPNLPSFFQRLPILERNIAIEVGLK